jgi:hypothetical protein
MHKETRLRIAPPSLARLREGVKDLCLRGGARALTHQICYL